MANSTKTPFTKFSTTKGSSRFTQPLAFNRRGEPIDYFRINCARLRREGYACTEHKISLDSNRHFGIELLNRVEEQADQSTIVLNIQAGKGKTSTCYAKVKSLVEQGYKVIMASPYKKLLSKDISHLTGFGLTVSSYEQLEAVDPIAVANGRTPSLYQSMLLADVLVVTTNFLLQDPTERHFQQSTAKQSFIEFYRTQCEATGVPVCIVFDEIHDSVGSFRRDLIPNLTKWRTVVDKCIVASATFTSASEAVIRYISLLTERRIAVVDVPRVKSATQAELHLHLTHEHYNASGLHAFPRLLNTLQDIVNSGRKLNIIAPFKATVDYLTNREKQRGSPLQNFIAGLNPNVITGDTDNSYVAGRHNIGTAFTTGVNIDGNRESLIIILPSVDRSDAPLGVFTNTLPVIIQSISRVRGIAPIHVFARRPTVLLTSNDNPQASSLSAILDIGMQCYQSQNYISARLRRKQIELQRTRQQGIDYIVSIQKPSGQIALGYSYPSPSEYFINYGEVHGRMLDYSAGKDVSSYLLWAALNEQFCNCRCVKIEYTVERRREVQLKRATLQSDLDKLITSKNLAAQTRTTVGQATVRLALGIATSMVTSPFSFDKKDEEIIYKNEFVLDGTQISHSELIQKSEVFRKIGNIVAGHPVAAPSDLFDDYILYCTEYARNSIGSSSGGSKSAMIDAYVELSKLADDFETWLLSHAKPHPVYGRAFHRDVHSVLPRVIMDKAFEVSQKLKASDPTLASGRIQFLHKAVDAGSAEWQQHVFKEFRNQFLVIRRSHQIKVDGQEEWIAWIAPYRKVVDPRYMNLRWLL